MDGGVLHELDWGAAAYGALMENVRTVERAGLDALAPPPPFDPAAWAVEHARFPDNSPAPGPFRHETSPYLKEILEVLSPDHPAVTVTVIKCKQSGGTVCADLWLAGLLSTVSAAAMMIQPTVSQVKEWADNKFWTLAGATPPLDPERGGAVLPRMARTEGGSTTSKLRFANGSYIMLAGAESPNTLRSHTIQFMVRDDISGWTDNSGGEGSPLDLSDARVDTYRELGLAKVFDISTPLIARACEITARYEASDRRRFYMGCKECEARTDWDWEDVQRNDEPPFEAHLICPACGTVHEPSDKRAMLARGMWIPTRPYGGGAPPKTLATDAEARRWKHRDMGPYAAKPGFHITGVMNRYANWDYLAELEEAARDTPDKQQTFYNLHLGRAFEIDTETPDWEALKAHASEEFRRGEGAFGPCVFILSADVQSYGIKWLIKGYNANEEQFYLDWGLVPGETAEKGQGAWPAFEKLADRGAPLPGGARFDFDLEVIDANYNTDAVKHYVKRRPKALAINGAPGWNKDIIYRAETTGLKPSGKKRRIGGVKVWHVGTYTAKAVLVARYGKILKRDAITELGPARGYCWFPSNVDEAFLRELTSEFVHTEIVKATGFPRRTWKVKTGEENHWFDADVYNFAGLEYLGARAGERGRWSEADWAERIERVARTIDQEGVAQSDLFDARAGLARRVEDQEPAADTAAMLRRLAGLNKS